MLRYIICEDNSNFLQKISEVVHKTMMSYQINYKVNKFTGFNNELEELIKDKNDHKVYILDVEIPEVSGLEIASMISIRLHSKRSTVGR